MSDTKDQRAKLLDVRETLAEAGRYTRSDRVEAARLVAEAAAGLEEQCYDDHPRATLWGWCLDTLRAATEALVVDPDAAKGGIALVRHSLGRAIGRRSA